MRVLIVEDDQQLNAQLKQFLQEAGYSVDTAQDGRDGLFKASEYPYDVAVIDLGLPTIDGIALIKKVRAKSISYPILILTARERWQDKVEGLDAGADDYLTKPFHHEEMLARLNALLRRSVGLANPIVTYGPITLNTTSQQVEVNQKPLELTAYEYKVLEYLILHPGKVVSKTELTEHIYAQDFDRDSNTIEVFVGRLRRKLDPLNEFKPIETLRGRGYRFTISQDDVC